MGLEAIKEWFKNHLKKEQERINNLKEEERVKTEEQIKLEAYALDTKKKVELEHKRYLFQYMQASEIAMYKESKDGSFTVISKNKEENLDKLFGTHMKG